jgi:hypothetical protein
LVSLLFYFIFSSFQGDRNDGADFYVELKNRETKKRKKVWVGNDSSLLEERDVEQYLKKRNLWHKAQGTS